MKPASALPQNDADRLIDSTLERLARVRPAHGFETRLARHIVAANATRSAKVVRFPFPARMGATAAAAALAAVAILLVSNDHTPRRISLPPAIHVSQQGFGAAGGHVSPSQPVRATVRPRSVISRSKGRAVLAPRQVRKTHGTAVPQSPYPTAGSAADQTSPSQP